MKEAKKRDEGEEKRRYGVQLVESIPSVPADKTHLRDCGPKTNAKHFFLDQILAKASLEGRDDELYLYCITLDLILTPFLHYLVFSPFSNFKK